jgi:hypothetical protein
MKMLLYLTIISLLSCSVKQDLSEGVNTVSSSAHKSEDKLTTVDKTNKNEYCWIGMLKESVPVCIYYVAEGELLIGQITYLKTKSKSPIMLLGSKEENGDVRLLEFDSAGNITGIITGAPGEDVFEGSWFSPKTRKELSLHATNKDTVIFLKNRETELSDVFGNYHYQYGAEGSQGDLSIKKIEEHEASFSIVSVTSAPARNIADVPEDTIQLEQTTFTYTIPESDHCGFKVKFYKEFAYVTYTNGYCAGQFGNNATVDGIYLKVK